MREEFYVYLHIRLDNGEPFYVGKGKKLRAKDKSNRNKHWHNVVNKHGYKYEIIFDNLTDEESKQAEIDCIAEPRNFGFNLVNYTNGGEGKLGYVTSEETKRKISEKNKGKVWTDEQKLRMSNTMKGRIFSDETRRKMSENNAFRRDSVKKAISEKNKKPVLCSNGIRFDSATDAQKWAVKLGKSTATDGSSITACCTGRQKSAYGLFWKYE